MDPLMTVWVFFIGCIVGILVGVVLSYRTAVLPLRHDVQHLTREDNKYIEKMKYYPFNLERFRFLGEPVAGIQFEDNAVLFVCFKEENDPYTPAQERIKSLVENGKVGWYEFLIG
jgi:hypothetical protein